MRFLLDTHIFLWFISGDAQLPAAWRDTIRQPSHEAYLSVVSLWESILKYQLGKLPLPEPPERYLPAQRERHQSQTCHWMKGAFNSLHRFLQFTAIHSTAC